MSQGIKEIILFQEVLQTKAVKVAAKLAPLARVEPEKEKRKEDLWQPEDNEDDSDDSYASQSYLPGGPGREDWEDEAESSAEASPVTRPLPEFLAPSPDVNTQMVNPYNDIKFKPFDISL